MTPRAGNVRTGAGKMAGMRFSIRDLLWLITLTAVVVSWYINRASLVRHAHEQASKWEERAEQWREQKLNLIKYQIKTESELEMQLLQERAEVDALRKEIRSR
jgi:hypothetical protein